MLIVFFNLILILLVVWLSYKYLDTKERMQPTYGRCSGFLSGIASIIDKIEGYNGNHAEEIAEISEAIGIKIGLDAHDLQSLYIASMLHDIGEIMLPQEILKSNEELSPNEFELMRSHPILGELHLNNEKSEISDEVSSIVRWHHERWDGMGYPDNLKCDEIPLTARIISLADAIVAMSYSRAYRKKQYEDKNSILWELKKMSGLQFDPQLVKIWSDIIESEKLEVSK